MKEKGIISNLYPTTKGLFVILSLILSLFYDWRFAYLYVFPLCILLSLIDGKLVNYLKKVMLALLVFVAFIFAFKIMLDKAESVVIFKLWFITITEHALLSALNQTKVILVLVSTIILFFETTDIEDLMISLQKMKVSHVVTYIVLSTLQLIPDMSKKSKVIMEAQQARGIETTGSIWRRIGAFFPSLGPLIISSITDIEDRSITLEVRGFSTQGEKTTLKVLDRNHIDKYVVVFLIVISAALLIWRFV